MSVRAEKAGNRILLMSSHATPGLKDFIPGAYFRDDKRWSFPLELETYKLLRERFGAKLEVGPLLWDWAKIEKRKRAELAEVAGSLDADLKFLPSVAPRLADAMSTRTYQRSGVRFIADTQGRDGRRRALLADTVGLGKTAQALGSVLESEAAGPFLIVCPKTAVNATWAAEIRRWLPDDEVITLPDTDAKIDGVKVTARQRRDDVLDDLQQRALSQPATVARTWVVVHPYSIRTQVWWICALCASQTKYTRRPTKDLDCGHPKDRSTKTSNDHEFRQLFGFPWGAMVVDESDQILIMLTGTPNLQRTGADLLRDLVRPGGVRLAMSGTPFRSKSHQLWSTLNWLDPVRWGAKWRWVERYWHANSGQFGGISIGAFREEREAMLNDELSDVMLRRTRDDVRDDLPAKLYAGTPLGDEDGSPVGVWLPMEGKQLRAYKQMEQTATANLAGGDVTAIGVLAELTRLKQFAGAEGEVDPNNGEFRPVARGNKYEWLVEFLTELGFPDKPITKVTIASQFTQMLNVFREGIAKEFGDKKRVLRTAAITGEVSQHQREQAIEEFEDPNHPLSVLFLNTKAGGSSITLDAAEVMVILDETWVDDEQEQLEGRIDNRNPEKRIVPRTYYYLRSSGSVEERIAVGNAEAKRAGKRLLDGAKSPAFKDRMLGNA